LNRSSIGVEKYAPPSLLSPVHDPGIRTVCLAVEGRLDERRFSSRIDPEPSSLNPEP
jgi:hypothetical protein